MTTPSLHADDATVIAQSWHEPEKFAELYDRHAAFIHRYVSRRLGDGMADDVVAETFLAAFRWRRRYDLDQANALPWLYGIAANMIGKHRRAEMRRLRMLARTGAEPAAEGYADRIDSRVSAATVQRDLIKALAGLSAGEREVLLLIACADLTYEETAAALGIPLGTVRSRLNRARKRVREALGGRLDPDRPARSIRQRVDHLRRHPVRLLRLPVRRGAGPAHRSSRTRVGHPVALAGCQRVGGL
jgi:RNA polymerase sigma-70 factor (ECF subfamily)